MALIILAGCGKSKSKTEKPKAKDQVRNNYAFGKVIGFGRRGGSDLYKRGGWGETEKELTWSTARTAHLIFTLPESEKPWKLRARLAGFTNPPDLPFQPVEVWANNELVAEWQVSELGDFVAIIPAQLSKREQLYLDFRLPRAASPKALNAGEDPRTVGVSCSELEFTEGKRRRWTT